MLKEILKECIKEMMEDKMLLFTLDPDETFDIKSYTLKRLGKSQVYCCETDSQEKAFYVEESRVKKKIQNKRNKIIDNVLNRQE